MKIIYVGIHNPFFITNTEYTEDAISDLGHICIPFDDRKWWIPGRIRARIPFLEKLDLLRINRNLLSLVALHKPDLCLVTGGHRIFSKTIQKIKAQGIKTALWTLDAPVDFEPIIKVASYHDYIFCAGTEAIELLNNNKISGAKWLPFACDTAVHKPVEISSADREGSGSDVVFVGSHYPNRLKILEQLTDLNLAVWGPGWENIAEDSPLKKHIKGSKLKPEDWLKIYAASKIIIVIHYQDGKNPCYQASPKLYETLAARGFVLCDDQKDVKALFRDGKHLAIFKDIDDLREKINYYLVHEEERQQIAKAGYLAVIAKHTYKDRIKELIAVVTK